MNLFLRKFASVQTAAASWKEALELLPKLAIPKLGDSILLMLQPPQGRPEYCSAGHFLGGFEEFCREQMPKLGSELRTFSILGGQARGWIVSIRWRNGLVGLISGIQMNSRQSVDLDIVQDFALLAGILLESTWNREQTKAAIRSRDELLISATHELSTPLTTMKLQIYALRKNFQSMRTKPNSILDIIELQLARLEAVVGNVLEASRVAAGLPGLVLQDGVDFGAIVKQSVEKLKVELSVTRSPLRLTCDEGVLGRWDAARLRQIVLNLLSNAVKFGRGQPISVRLCRKEEQAFLEVVDSGRGISYPNLHRAFAPWKEGDQVLEYSGLGLGLFITKALVEAHGGSIEAFRHEGGGTKILVSLPLVSVPTRRFLEAEAGGLHRKVS